MADSTLSEASKVPQKVELLLRAGQILGARLQALGHYFISAARRCASSAFGSPLQTLSLAGRSSFGEVVLVLPASLGFRLVKCASTSTPFSVSRFPYTPLRSSWLLAVF